MNKRRPIRIAYIDHTSEMGGAEHLLLTLFAGISPELVIPILICAEEGVFTLKAQQIGVSVRIISLPRFASLSFVIGTRKILNPVAFLYNAFCLVIGAWRISRCLDKENIDIVQTNSAFSHIYGGIAAKIIRVPCIWYFHDLVEVDRLGGSIVLVWRFLARLLAYQVVAVSNAVLSSLGIGNKGTVVYAGCSHPPEVSGGLLTSLWADLDLPKDSKLVGYVGRISYVKGLDILAESVKTVLQTAPNTHFVLLGEPLFAENPYKAALVNKVELLGIQDHWHWYGYDPNATAHMNDFHVLVLPSRREAFGLVLLEAGLAGKAVVATTVGGIPEIIIDYETGILVPPGSPQDLSAALLELLTDPGLADRMGRNATQRVKKHFNLQRYYDEFNGLYSKIALPSDDLPHSFVRSL